MKLWLSLWIAILSAGPGAEPSRYSVMAVRDDIAVGTPVGPLKAGLICLPAGRLRWDQIARPTEATLVEHADGVLSGDSTAPDPDPFARPADRGASADYRVVITIRAARLKLCVAGLGIGERKPAGAGAVDAVVATLERATQRRLPNRLITVPIHLDGRDPRKDASVYADIVADIARRYAADLPE